MYVRDAYEHTEVIEKVVTCQTYQEDSWRGQWLCRVLNVNRNFQEVTFEEREDRQYQHPETVFWCIAHCFRGFTEPSRTYVWTPSL